MRKRIAISFVLLMSALYSFAAGDAGASWQRANVFYKQKQYDSAALYYEKIAALKPHNAEVYYNLGNSYYRLNKIGPAVLNYERALRIAPMHKNATENLHLAQSRIPNYIHPASDIFFVQWWHNITAADKATTWAVTSLIIFLVFIALQLIRQLRRSAAGSIPVQLYGLLIVLFACSLFLAFFAAKNSSGSNSAVVMENDAPLMNNELKGKSLLLVPEGTIVMIRERKGDYAEVSLPDGRTGWLRSNVFTEI